MANILPVLFRLGYAPTAGQYSPWSFGGDYFVDFHGPGGHSLRILYDRSQYTVSGDRAELESVGLWRAFDDRSEFEYKLLPWLHSLNSE